MCVCLKFKGQKSAASVVDGAFNECCFKSRSDSQRCLSELRLTIDGRGIAVNTSLFHHTSLIWKEDNWIYMNDDCVVVLFKVCTIHCDVIFIWILVYHIITEKIVRKFGFCIKIPTHQFRSGFWFFFLQMNTSE